MLAMEYLADSSQRPPISRGVDNVHPQPSQDQRRRFSCKHGCCGRFSTTSWKCMGICAFGTLLLIIGIALIALHFTTSDQNQRLFLIPALVLCILGIIFLSIAEWICRVKVYHRYGRSHQRTLERLSGIERRLNSGATRGRENAEEPPSYELNEIFAIELPTPVLHSIVESENSENAARPPTSEALVDEAPSYNKTVSDDVLPSYQEATSSEYNVVNNNDKNDSKAEVKDNL